MNRIDDIANKIAQAAKEKTSLVDALNELGLTPDQPEKMTEIIKQAGFTEQQLADARSLAEQMVHTAPPEARRQLLNFMRMIGDAFGPIPESVEDFLRDLEQSS